MGKRFVVLVSTSFGDLAHRLLTGNHYVYAGAAW